MQSIETQTRAIFKKLDEDPQNKRCCDCKSESASWASVNHGIFICIQCAGVHRGFGVNISFVRSLTLDTWSHQQLSVMSCGGNKKFLDFMDKYGVTQDKYQSKAAAYYRAMLKAAALNEEFVDEAPEIQDGVLPINFPAPSAPCMESEEKENGEEFEGEITKKKKKNVFKDALVASKSFRDKISVKVKEFSDKPKVKRISDKTKDFFEEVNGKIKDIVHKTKESEFYQKAKEKSVTAYKSLKISAKSTINKIKKKPESQEEDKINFY